jgi:hypothetical protein
MEISSSLCQEIEISRRVFPTPEIILETADQNLIVEIVVQILSDGCTSDLFGRRR